MKITFIFLIVFSFSISLAQEKNAPRVIKTFPLNGSTNVDPNIKEISVTFDKTMMDKSWSWAYRNKHQFPVIVGKAYYTNQFTKNNLPVKLQSKKTYIIWINSEKFRNFKSQTGSPAHPFKFTFTTR